MVGQYWGTADSLLIFDPEDVVNHTYFSVDSRIRIWLAMLCRDSENIDWVRSHIKYYLKTYHYHVQPSAAGSRLLVLAICSRQLAFMQEVLQLRCASKYPCTTTDEFLAELREAKLVDQYFVKEAMVRGSTLLRQWVLCCYKKVAKQCMTDISWLIVTQAFEQIEQHCLFISTPSIDLRLWRHLAYGVSTLDSSEKKSRVLALCHEILDPYQLFQVIFDARACHIYVCQSNDVEYARKLPSWSILSPKQKDRCLMGALKTAFLCADPRFNRHIQDAPGSMLRFLVQEKKMDRFETQDCKLSLLLIDAIHTSENGVAVLGKDLLAKSSIKLEQFVATPFRDPRTLEFVLKKIHDSRNTQENHVANHVAAELVSNLMERYNRCHNKSLKNNWYPVWQKYNYDVSDWTLFSRK